MCGFLGEYNFSGKVTDSLILKEFLALSKRRGPDESRQWMNQAETVWLGFNRLAIQDLSDAGSQPMLSPSGRYALVFNGEIYNHLELREKLPLQPYRGHSDTETILACIEHWGFLKTVEALDGMFALALYDQQEKALYAARDFAGIKPFFYGWNGKSFAFASQYNQITRHPLFKNNPVDEQVLKLYLQQHFVPAPFGLIKQTGQLEPGQWCKVSEKGLEKGYFWEFPDYHEPDIFSEKEAFNFIEEGLRESVRDEMISDVPLGAFLSGGIDSPLICHFAQKFTPSGLQTFTIGSDSKVHDESELAQQYAHLIGTTHHLKKASAADLMASFDEVMQQVHEPMADFSIIPTYWVSKLAREQVTVALSGDGGDELFFGYERFWSVVKNISYQHYPFPLKALIYKWDQYRTGNKRINSVLLSPHQGKAHQGLHSRFSDVWVNRLFPYLQKVSIPDSYLTYNYSNTRSEKELIQAMRKAEFYGMMQKTLRKVDLASMGVSLEVRVPFLKKSFIERSLRIDPMLSYGSARKKQLLKNLLYHYYPQAPIDNVKRGFSVPLGNWMRDIAFMENLKERYFNPLFSEMGMEKSAFHELTVQHLKGKDHKWPLFTLMALGKSLNK